MRKQPDAMLLAAFALGACASLSPASGPTEKTVFVTRHMQKAEGNDPSLSAEGAAAAEGLADALADKGVSAVFATPTRRTMETAAPLARRMGLAVTPYNSADPESLAGAVAAARGAVLVVGHSNTVADLVARLGGRTPPEPLTEEDYGTVFVIDAKGEVQTFEVG